MRILVLTTTGLLLASCMAQKDVGPTLGKTTATPPAIEATAQLLGPNGELRGTATVSQTPAGTRVAAHIEGLPAGTYAIHLHAVGKCDAPKFTTAGAHFNPTMKQHGRDNPMGPHEGDLPNVVVGSNGTGDIDYTVAGMTLKGGTAPLLDADGAAIVLHAGPDDYRTDPSGNSGDRIACGAFAPRS